MPLSEILLHWYDRHRRHLPWRTDRPDPYRVWLSEIMLQQTTVQAVIPYFQTFVQRWPTVRDLAAADLDDILVAWAGLGYYARARNLHACAKAVAAAGGTFPDGEDGLLALPGIGAYTAAAIAAIAFDRPAVVVDGNVERVMSRMFMVSTPLPAAKPHIKRLAATLTPTSRPGDYAQAVMDLGATLCTPRSPACALCPWSDPCQARVRNRAAEFPIKAPKDVKPTRHGLAFWTCDDRGRVLIRRRPESGLLGGMMEIPSTPWREGESWTLAQASAHAPAAAAWRALDKTVRHTFTHFHLELAVVKGIAAYDPGLGHWCLPDALDSFALPTAMKKIVRLCSSS